MLQKNIVFVAMNNEHFIYEMFVSIHSLLQVSPKVFEQYRVIVYTNRLDLLSKNDLYSEYIHVIEVTEDMMISWIGENHYIYNIKIGALIDCINRYRAPTILIDTDTFFLKDIETVFEALETNNGIIMNYLENRAEQTIRYEMKHKSNMAMFMLKHVAKGYIEWQLKRYTLNEQTEFWNSGVIGVRPEHMHYLVEALALSSHILETYRIRTAEQMALSIIFQHYSDISSSDDTVFHYWFLKEARYLLEANYGITSVYAKKHINSTLVTDMLELKQSIGDINLPKTIFVLTKKNYIQKFSNLYKVMDSNSEMGKLLRKINDHKA